MEGNQSFAFVRMPCVSFLLRAPRFQFFSSLFCAAPIKITPMRGYSSVGRRHVGQRGQWGRHQRQRTVRHMVWIRHAGRQQMSQWRGSCFPKVVAKKRQEIQTWGSEDTREGRIRMEQKRHRSYSYGWILGKSYVEGRVGRETRGSGFREITGILGSSMGIWMGGGISGICNEGGNACGSAGD